MRRTWILYALILTMSLVWASFYGGPLPYMTLYTVLGIPLCLILYLGVLCIQLRFYQEISKNFVKKGEEITLRISMENVGLLPAVGVELVADASLSVIKDLDSHRKIYLAPGERSSSELKLTCLYAGRYDVGIEGFRLRDFLGFFSFTYRPDMMVRAIVCPRITDDESMARSWLDTEHSQWVNRNRTQEILGTDIRLFARGDRLQQIHWKNSARLNQLVSRTPEPEELAQYFIILQPASKGALLETIRRRDHFLETAVSLAHFFLSQRQPVVFACADKEPVFWVINSQERFLEFYQKVSADLPYKEEQDEKSSDMLLSTLRTKWNATDIRYLREDEF